MALKDMTEAELEIYGAGYQAALGDILDVWDAAGEDAAVAFIKQNIGR